MRRGIKKAIAALSSCAIMICTVPMFGVAANASGESLIKIVEDDFEDAVTFGEGVFAKNGNNFANMSENDQYYYIAEDGTKTSLTDNIKENSIDAMYKSTTRVNYLLNGVVPVGRNGKVTFMDKDGALWGEPIYSSVLYVNDNLFMGNTNEQFNPYQSDGWGLYRKDGTLVESFNEGVVLNITSDGTTAGEVEQPKTVIQNNKDIEIEKPYEIEIETLENGDEVAKIQENSWNSGYSYVHDTLLCIHRKNGNSVLVMYDAGGTKIAEMENIKQYYISELSEYIGMVGEDGNAYIYDFSGQLLFTVTDCNYINVEELQQYGYASVSKNRIVNTNGDIVVDGDFIAGFDEQAALVWHGEEATLVNMDNEQICSVTSIYEEMLGEGYDLVTASVYYSNTHLFVSVYKENANTSEEHYATRTCDIDGNTIGEMDGYWLRNGGSYSVKNDRMILYEGGTSNAVLADLECNQIATNQRGLSFWMDEYYGEAPTLLAYNATYDSAVGKYMYTLYFENGTVVTSFDSPRFINERAVVTSENGCYVIGENGQHITEAGKYQRYNLFADSLYIIGINGYTSELLDETGAVLSDNTQYRCVNHMAKFTPFLELSSDVYENGITATNMLVAENTSGKVNILKIDVDTNPLDPLGPIPDQVYTGKQLRPAVQVTSGGNILKKGKDYVVEYSNNVSGGTGKVIVRGIGYYSGVQTAEFAITYKSSAAPTEIAAVFTKDNSVRVTWNKVEEASGYIIYRKDSETNTYKYLMMTSKNDVLGIVDKNVSKSKKYSYRIYSYNNYDKRVLGPASEEATAEVKALPSVQNIKAVSAGKNKVKLTWSAVKGADGYLIYATKDGKYSYCGMTTTGTSFTDKKALDKNYNFYWVFAYETGSDKKQIVGESGKYVFAKGIIPTITNLQAKSVKGSVNLTWSKATDAQGYLIYGKTASGKYGYIGMTTTGTSYADKKASTKEYNFYWVYAYYKDSSGKNIISSPPKYVYGKAK